MKFGVREICDVVFKAKSSGKMGNYSYVPGQPVLYIDSAKTSTIEGAATTVYATGGRGNSRLIAWEGEKTLTFTVEDALLSPIGFAILSGAGLFEAADDKKIKVHMTANAYLDSDGVIDLSEKMPTQEDKIDGSMPLFVMETEEDGSLGKMIKGFDVNGDGDGEDKKVGTFLQKGTDGLSYSDGSESPEGGIKNKNVFVDFYIERTSNAQQLEIEAGNFAGYYYVEASTLFRRQIDGEDLAAEIIFPNVKIQSNFTFNMAATGDPSTFTFTMDAMPGYTNFNPNKKVLCVMQIIDESIESDFDAAGDSIIDNG